MPRPQLAIGDYGNISYSVTVDGQHVAMARFRDADGETRRVRAQGRSKGAATAALKAKFKERASLGDLSGESRVAELAERYYLAKGDDGLAPNTRYNQRRALDNHVIPKLGKLRVREVTPPRVERVVGDIAKENGPGTALVVRSTLSGMFAAAIRWGATATNPVQFTPVPKVERKEVRALTGDEYRAMRAYAIERLRPETTGERLARAGGDRRRMAGPDRKPHLLDVMDFLLATGCRPGEVLGTAWVDVHLDAPVPWVRIYQQVVQVVGEGLRLTPTKERDVRHLPLPGFAVEMLLRRRVTATGPMVFEGARGGLMQPSSISWSWRTLFKPDVKTRAGLSDAELWELYPWHWVTQKTLRKTVATLVDAAHGSALASKQLGHASDKMTLRHYIAKSLAPLDTGNALEQFQHGA